MTATVRARTLRAASPVYRRLTELATEFEMCAGYYERWTGSHNELLAHESHRAAAQLRVVAEFVRVGLYSQQAGAIWVRAAWRIITAIGRANLQ
jgi:hypothetical protein